VPQGAIVVVEKSIYHKSSRKSNNKYISTYLHCESGCLGYGQLNGVKNKKYKHLNFSTSFHKEQAIAVVLKDTS
jgi:hypothetical protein